MLDSVITNVVIIDYTGIVKADIGIKDGRIIGIGKAGNQNSMDGVGQDMIIGVGGSLIIHKYAAVYHGGQIQLKIRTISIQVTKM